MKIILLFPIFWSFIFLIGNAAIATRPAHRKTPRDREKEFCQRSPYHQDCVDFIPEDFEAFCLNSPQDKRCSDKERLLRQQDNFYCTLSPNLQKSNYCKIIVGDNTITVYFEQTEPLGENNKRKEIVIKNQDIFNFNSPWWLADVGDEIESVGMFAEIQIGYFVDNPQSENKSNFLTISADSISSVNTYLVAGFSNENIPKILEKLEPWLYFNPDLAVMRSRLKNVENTNTEIAKNVRRLLDTRECPRCDLRGANLAKRVLTGANLEGANLEGANLEGANLQKAYLIGANLNNANLYEANLKNSILMLSSLENSDLAGANLQAANLTNTNLNNANLTQARLSTDGLNVTQLQAANLTNANLTEADLSCANLDSANLKNANLTKANLEKCTPKFKIRKGEISKFLLNKAKVSTPLSDLGDTLSIVNSVITIFSSMSGGSNSINSLQNLENLGTRSIDFIGNTNLSNVNLSGANLTEANFEGADLFSSNLSNAILDRTNFENADLSNSNLVDAKPRDLNLEKAFLCNAIMPDLSIDRQECDR